MDLSYRKAGKMDATDFMARFHPELLGLSELVRGQLLEGDEDSKGLRTELYKLNVYGQWVYHSSLIQTCLTDGPSYDKRKGLILQVS